MSLTDDVVDEKLGRPWKHQTGDPIDDHEGQSDCQRGPMLAKELAGLGPGTGSVDFLFCGRYGSSGRGHPAASFFGVSRNIPGCRGALPRRTNRKERGEKREVKKASREGRAEKGEPRRASRKERAERSEPDNCEL